MEYNRIITQQFTATTVNIPPYFLELKLKEQKEFEKMLETLPLCMRSKFLAIRLKASGSTVYHKEGNKSVFMDISTNAAQITVWDNEGLVTSTFSQTW